MWDIRKVIVQHSTVQYSTNTRGGGEDSEGRWSAQVHPRHAIHTLCFVAVISIAGRTRSAGAGAGGGVWWWRFAGCAGEDRSNSRSSILVVTHCNDWRE